MSQIDNHPHADIEARDLADLAGRFPDFVQRDLVVNMDGPGRGFFDEIRQGLQTKDRRGEVVLLLRRPDGRLWLHRKRVYPPAAYRLLSGGIQKNEPALDAAARECWEETGFVAPIVGCPGVLRYRLERAGASLRFISYFFVMDVSAAAPDPQDAGEQICSFRSIAPADLPGVAATLRSVPPDWQDWGIFRAIGHEFAWERWSLTSQ
jgi:8-oxo-dGTP pyrophosphatase MutT (NUDIX family)